MSDKRLGKHPPSYHHGDLRDALVLVGEARRTASHELRQRLGVGDLGQHQHLRAGVASQNRADGIGAAWLTARLQAEQADIRHAVIGRARGTADGCRDRQDVIAARIELAEVTCAGKPYPNQVVDVTISVR